jgi:hypothetical protein
LVARAGQGPRSTVVVFLAQSIIVVADSTASTMKTLAGTFYLFPLIAGNISLIIVIAAAPTSTRAILSTSGNVSLKSEFRNWSSNEQRSACAARPSGPMLPAARPREK